MLVADGICWLYQVIFHHLNFQTVLNFKKYSTWCLFEPLALLSWQIHNSLWIMKRKVQFTHINCLELSSIGSMGYITSIAVFLFITSIHVTRHVTDSGNM